MSPQYTVKCTAPNRLPAGAEGKDGPACHGHRDCEPTGDEGRAHIWIVAGKGVAAAQLRDRMAFVQIRMPSHAPCTELMSRRPEAVPGCEHLC